ncbi:glycoside hydrolase family 32 protein [Jeotgalibacillus sp. S-D1]|uniref:glycoside hydrolase family 32 protein n=1 Tax=Jeotgalibacillus sp. S-D1 TaxID=2552189 RepID=UPI00105A39A8|nr:glycoside hydrolase family 32 protein [Jeotgalibacillus sp. S-D1]TDL31020.1 glycoside hydrolase family 32 protein [Jeotgalibacillus sp. S-D1]
MNKNVYRWIGLSLLVLLFIGTLVYFLLPDKSEDPSYRADYHFTAPDNWKNDPQKPIYLDGEYHYFYLYNGDYPDGNGTEWRHSTSEDLVHWKDEGIAIPKYTNENGDPWSGSVVIDKENTAGFGKDALIAVVTQPSKNDQKQEQFLWYSTDNGKTFNSYSDDPIMSNPGTKDFRDPKIIWDDEHHKWVMTMAEGTKIGFYESDNLKDWQYTSSFETENIGLLECPDLYIMRADDGTLQWVLGASANGESIGKPNTYAYWTGSFDGKDFIPDHQEPKWLDYGFDWYGGVTFESGTDPDKYNKRYALAWMNNWAYADNTPTMEEGFNGMDSIVREIELKHENDGHYALSSQPVEALDTLTQKTDSIDRIEVDGSETLDVTGDSYQIEADISWEELTNAGFRLRESDDHERHVDVGIFPEQNYSYVNRAFTHHPDESNEMVENTAPFEEGKKEVHLKILVDKTSIEVFVDDGKVAYSNLIFPEHEDKGITLFSEGGTAAFENIKITHFNSIH